MPQAIGCCQYAVVAMESNAGKPSGRRRPPVFGPEPWPHAAPSGRWTYWDVWFAVVCVVDCGSDWDEFDAHLTRERSGGMMHGTFLEPLWSHLLDLRERLTAARLGAAELADEAVRDPKVVARARAKVWRQPLEGRAKTEAMCSTPGRRLSERALTGAWPSFPVSPQGPYETLVQGVDLDRHHGQWATMALAEVLVETTIGQIEAAGGDPARLLAVRRAALTCGVRALRVCDDSCGTLGEWLRHAVAEYTAVPWRQVSIPAAVFWRDFLEVLGETGDFGGTFRQETQVFLHAGVQSDLELVDDLVAELHREYAAARWDFRALEILGRRAYAQVAAGAVDRFAATAALLGSEDWQPLDAMVACALRRGDATTACAVLRAADRPGLHQDWVRRRALEVEQEGHT
ncbi:hypothetical protein F7R91_31360 [Streptomyces luteolifulvus]|uniref:Uncharacterized protein n=1 Tax=Streptomyces luteolifulvus TaxID=2615112 RepID=A0A6H9USV7_9ACTN|nr:hypothetical protein [Streptomyces luteolifulvus]KAB1141712.1 hypothetical protein F7R91_31360 [Streptomyces luteolifulvus]